MEVREFVFLNRNGKRMPATLRIPEGTVRGTMVLMHGLAAWKEQPTILVIANAIVRAGYQVLTFDGADALRGPDASYWSSTTSGFIEDLEDVLAYCTQQDWHKLPLALAGHSLGALCVVHYARQHPGVVSKLVLVAPAISWRIDRSDRMIDRIRWTMKVVRIVKKKEQEIGEKFFNPLYPPWILDYFKYDTRKDAPHVHVPALIVSAGDDLIVAGPKAQAALTRLFPDATQVVVPHASHIFHEHEKELTDTITQWLSSS
ncbi:MAG: alpha/beta fold hydrolase [Patescibacteria group bacterium]